MTATMKTEERGAVADTRPVSTMPEILLDLAAGRHPCDDAVIDGELLRVATDHRMTGLLWTWARDHLEEGDERRRLAIRDLEVQAHLRRVSRVLGDCVDRLAAAGIEVATIKGVTAEQRWFARPGERLASDVDLWIGPHDVQRIGAVLETLAPDHPWIPYTDALAASGRIQSITIRVDGLEVDLHLDLLKLGVPTRSNTDIWDRMVQLSLPNGGCVRVLDDSSALLQFLVHLNKDRFQRLLGFADVARVIGAGSVDWGRLVSLARRDGIETPVLCSLETVLDALELPWPNDLERPCGARAALWRWIWRPSIRLLGTEGRLRFRRRQQWIPFLARGRILEASRAWFLDLWPPSVTVQSHYGDVKGPYLWKLIVGRARSAADRRRQIERERASK